MDLDEPENAAGAAYSDESSGSAYEISDDDQSYDEDAEVLPTSRAGFERGRSRGVTKGHGRKDRKANRASSSEEAEDEPEVFEDTAAWASSFKEPKVEGIKTPPRLSRGGKKRKAYKPATESRVKRLKNYYSNDYRELLNSEIQDAASRVGDNSRLEGSQIGSSIWKVAEKTLMFTALERLGRDDIRGIAERIGSKSQHEVREYVNLLHHGMMERKQILNRTVLPTDLRAAIEVSDECAAVLERAGDALAVHQERAEEKVEKAKWGDTWLINQDVAFQIEKRRKQVSGEEEMQEVLPAANLLDLRNWVELSDRIFMNPASPRAEDNWHAIAEPGESPAVRATTFEDFHSLAFNITKRLVSTALFCCMSRLRARGHNKAKHAEVNVDDVEAAVKILRLKADSHDFWRGVAKRCSLQVIDDDYDKPLLMSYNEVDKALQERHPRAWSRSVSRTRSRIRSEQPEPSPRHPPPAEDMDSSPSDIDEGDLDSGSESEHASAPDSEEEFISNQPPESTSSESESIPGDVPSIKQTTTAPDARGVAEAAQDAHTEACDMYISQAEEIRLWDLLEQAPPFEFTSVLVQAKAPNSVRDVLADRENWREYVGYVNEWEEMDTPVTDEAFARNRRVSRIARRRAERVAIDGDVDVDSDSDSDDQDGNEEDHVDDEDGRHGDFATTDEREDRDESDDNELLQVESPRQYSPEYKSPDRQSDSSQGNAS
ncbi:hypothetical protein DL95DRAFT_382204 [Leptodontidium sp. 2 PMI_412]|nr:hypothetical protein DL95DRAFT_382204 [Leptodontidium sp. 2 PMI_412]